MSQTVDSSLITPSNASTLVKLLRGRSVCQPTRRAYTFLKDGETEEAVLTFGELDRQARIIASQLQSSVLPGERALLLYPPGLRYVAAFFGCLYAGVIATPAYPPRLNRNLSRLLAITIDSQAAVILGTSQTRKQAEPSFAQCPELSALPWLLTDNLPDGAADEWREPDIESHSTALLQYTSGSTATPKGVMVSHHNLLHNGRMIREAFALSEQTTIVSWLPLFHDMGLVGNMIQALFLGASCILMSPVAFLQQPYRWLQAISRYRADFSGGPNFAYDLCLNKVTREQRAELDLSCWRTAFNGAEPIRPQTLERFAATFAECGFDRRAWRPVYGLAEGTLFVSGKPGAAEPLARPFESAALEQRRAVSASESNDRATALVSCGQTFLGQKIIIVDPQSLTRCPPAQIGEIWVAGGSVAQGYWNKPEETGQVFKAFLTDTGEGPFLRTGDLGFVEGNELFVTGRYKDLIIIRGRNHYPQDIETTVGQCHPALKLGGGAAFAVEAGGEERLVVVYEVGRHHRRWRPGQIIDAIKQAIVDEHELEVYAIVLIKAGSLQKTSSGKVQRHVCRAQFLSRDLEVVEEYVRNSRPLRRDAGGGETDWMPPADSPAGVQRVELIKDWLISRVAEQLGVAPGAVDTGAAFNRLGVDSVGAVRISGDLETWMGRSLSPTIIYEYPNIDALAGYLAGGSSAFKAAVEPGVSGEVRHEPIAIIGIGCRFPGARDAEEFWRILCEQVDAITEVPPGRWNLAAFHAAGPEEPGKANTRWGGFLDGIDQFDPYFWGISPREAARIDPQQRLLLEVTWEALENAGQIRERLAGARVGVFIGISGNEYARLQFSDPALIDAYAGTGNALSIAANRLSYLFDWRGPSLAVDTACSSSLVAVHLACQSLNNAESVLAVAGGVNLILTPALAINFTKAGVMAPDGRCKAFDARADGYVRSEGAGVVILKRLSAAIADGDPIHAVILGSAVNQDGHTNGLMAPSRQAQEAVLEQAYWNAGVSPGEVRYVEAHGTGTLLGDTIEAQALGAVLSRGRPPGNKCAIGSVKTNIGHLEAAAGVAGLIKVALSLKRHAIPPNLHFHQPNPYLDFEALPLHVQRTFSPWPEGAGRVVAGVSSFGFGGTNAHLVLADPDHYRPRRRRPAGVVPERAKLLTLSAHSLESLRSLAQSHLDCLSTGDSVDDDSLSDWCFTANMRRSHHDYRLALVGYSRQEIAGQLKSFLFGGATPSVFFGRRTSGRQLKPVFVFPGQGSQWRGMGRELLTQEPVFRKTIELCDREMREYAAWSLFEELEAGEERNRFDQIDVIQPAIFAVQVGLASLWRAWGVEPQAVVGQSLGEVAAAYISGCLSLKDAARVICRRSQLIKRMSGLGAMAVVELSMEQAKAALAAYESQLSIAVSNSPTSTVLAGAPEPLERLIAELRQKGVFCRTIKVDVASHSPQMEPLREEMLQALEGLQPRPSTIPIYSTVTGGPGDGRHFDALYWMRNLREPALFSEAIRQLAESGYDLFLEISPHPVLLDSIKQGLRYLNREGQVLPSLARYEDERAVMLKSLGALFVSGCPVNWAGFYSVRGESVALPAYPWQRERCWFEDEMGFTPEWVQGNWNRQDHTCQRPWPGRYFKAVFPADAHYWEVELDRKRMAFLEDYRVHGAVVLPGAAYIEMVLAAAARAFGTVPQVLSEIEFQRPLILPDHGTRVVQITLASGSRTELDFRIYSRPGHPVEPQPDQWLLHATGKIPLRPAVN